ncbi:hypothetical protein AB4254_11505 [Vibrio breoganii]
MSQTTQANVLHLNTSEHAALLSQLAILGNRHKVDVILKAALLPINNSKVLAEQPLPEGSLAANLGHTSLRAFVESPQGNSGLGMLWSDFSNMVDAATIRERYKIALSSDSQVIAEFNDVVSYLKREPFDAQEYADTRNSLVLTMKESISSKYEAQMVNKTSQVTEAQKQMRVADDRAEQYRRQAQEKDEAIQVQQRKYTEEMEDKRIRFESRLSSELEVQREGLVKEHEKAIASATNTLQDQLSQTRRDHNTLKATHKMEIDELSNQKRGLEASYRSELKAANEVNTTLLQRTQELEGSLSVHKHKADTLFQSLMNLEEKIIHGDVKITDINLIDAQANLKEIESQKEKIEQLDAKVTALGGSNKKLRVAAKRLQGMVEFHKAQIEKAKVAVVSRNRVIDKQKALIATSGKRESLYVGFAITMLMVVGGVVALASM